MFEEGWERQGNVWFTFCGVPVCGRAAVSSLGIGSLVAHPCPSITEGLTRRGNCCAETARDSVV